MKNKKSITNKLPVLFIGHGSPINAIEENMYTLGWKSISKKFATPRAILCISAHWLREGTAVTAMEHPRTIHDFYGFPESLYQVQYPAPGSKKIAEEIIQIITSVKITSDLTWGLDHGTWSVLNHMYPKANIPVLQLSLDYALSNTEVFKIGVELQSLREKGVLIIGSGNIVHNLGMMTSSEKTFDWAKEFDLFIKTAIEKNNFNVIIDYTKNKNASIAHPTNEHFLPLLYLCGVAGNDKAQFFSEGIVHGSLSMMSIAWGL